MFFAGLGGWAAMAPLASAAIAPGVVSPDGSRRTVQHLEGGIIREILVEDGSLVEVGDPLLVLAGRGGPAPASNNCRPRSTRWPPSRPG